MRLDTAASTDEMKTKGKKSLFDINCQNSNLLQGNLKENVDE